MEDLTGFPTQSTGAGQPMVSFKKVRKAYGPLVVLDDLDLDVSAGEMVSIIGPSGSGKTTVLRMLMTLEQINGGVIYVDSKPLTHMEKNGKLVPACEKHLRARRSDIGMCFQHFNLFPHMTAIQNCMEGPVQVLGLSKAEARDRGEELLELVGMADKKDQHPSRLSGGQQQRVAIARALAGEPRLLLADEPTGNLDSLMARQVMDLLETINDAGTTIIMVTHDPDLARRSKRNIQIIDGQVNDFDYSQSSSLIQSESNKFETENTAMDA